MRILEVTSLNSKVFEAPSSTSKQMHGMYARDPYSGKLIQRNGEYFVWLYDLTPIVGKQEKYTPGKWWDDDILPNKETYPNPNDYEKVLKKNKENIPFGQPNITAIKNAIKLRKPEEIDVLTMPGEDLMAKYIPNNAGVGYWHRIGQNSEPYNLGKSRNQEYRLTIAELMYTLMGDKRFKPTYDDSKGKFDYNQALKNLDGDGDLSSDGTIHWREIEDHRKLAVKKQQEFQQEQSRSEGAKLKHDRTYPMRGSGVKYKYISELEKTVDGEKKTVVMDPLRYPNDPNHQPYFIRVADNKKVPVNSAAHALICASLGFEADTVTKMEDSLAKKTKDWFTKQFSLYGDDLDPKAPLFTKIIKKGIYDPISKVIFNQIDKSIDKKYEKLKQAYGWQDAQGQIQETDEAKKSIIYWEQKLDYLADEIVKGSEDVTVSELLENYEAHLLAYEQETKNKTFSPEDLKTAKRNIKKYTALMTKYYGSNFNKGDIVMIKPDIKGIQGAGNEAYPTIGFSCSGVVQARGIAGNHTIPDVRIDPKTGKYLPPKSKDAKEYDKSQKLDVVRTNDGTPVYRKTVESNSLIVKLHFPEIGLDIKVPQGPNGDGFLFYTGEITGIKPGKRVVSKDHHDMLTKIAQQAMKLKNQEDPNYKPEQQEKTQILQKGISIVGGKPQILKQKPENQAARLDYSNLKQGSKITWIGIEGPLAGKPVKGVVKSAPIVDQFEKPLSIDVAVVGNDEFRFNLHPERISSIG